jgi:hypothetical protein
MYGTYCRLGVHVWARDSEVIRQCWRKMFSAEAKKAAHRTNRKNFLRKILEIHHGEQELCKEFRL